MLTKDLTVEDFFAEDGLISKVKPDFRPRAGQAEFAEKNLQAMVDGGVVLSEAPTGFGKSFAVLVPAIIAAIKHGKRIVISTETLTLQDQYVQKDLPLLQEACRAAGLRFSYAVAKGKTNYICEAKLNEENLELTKNTTLMQWAMDQKVGQDDGDIASVPFPFDPREWGSLCADEDCEGKACPFYGAGRQGPSECFVFDAALRYLNADIIVANHTLTLLDISQDSPGTLLGTYHCLVVDEAHGFAEIAQDALGKTLKPRTVSRTLRLMDRMLRKVGVSLGEGFMEEFRELEERMFEPFAGIEQNIALKQVRPHKVDEARAGAVEIAARIKAIYRQLNDFIEGDEEDRRTIVIRAAKTRLSNLMSILSGIFGDKLDPEWAENWLTFVEVSRNNKGEIYHNLHLRPINVAPLLREMLFGQVATCILMSATMQIGGKFSYIKAQLGVPDEAQEFVGESPFDFESNVEAYFPKHLPDSKERGYIEALCNEVLEVIRYSNGRALVLFTNVRDMRTVFEYVSARTEHRCYLQGESSKRALLELFMGDVSSCLFATKTFFTGVDIPGEALSCLILTKTPFPVPTEPMFQAKADLLEREGLSSFALLSLPMALFDVRQGFGRLIRTTTDTGLFAFLDSRAFRKSYGRQIVNSLPRMRVTERLGQEAAVAPPPRKRRNLSALLGED